MNSKTCSRVRVNPWSRIHRLINSSQVAHKRRSDWPLFCFSNHTFYLNTYFTLILRLVLCTRWNSATVQVSQNLFCYFFFFSLSRKFKCPVRSSSFKDDSTILILGSFNILQCLFVYFFFFFLNRWSTDSLDLPPLRSPTKPLHPSMGDRLAFDRLFFRLRPSRACSRGWRARSIS